METASYPLRIRIHDPDPESQAGLASQVVAAGGTVVVDDPADAMIWDVRAGVPPTDLGPALVVAIPIGGQVPLLPDGATTLTLPATGTRLRAILRGIHRGRMSDTHPIIRAPVAVTTGIRILVAEDNPVNQRVAQAMLERLGHQVTVVADGAAAVAILSDQDFDLVLMDCQMPGMDGLEATRQIRLGANVRNPRIQIIALTANAMVGDRERCLEAGMNDYTPKPVTLASLREAITRSILRNVIR